MLLGLYRFVTGIGSPFWTFHLSRRVRQGKEDERRLSERRGEATIKRPDGPLFWIHAASVGEALLALPLINALLEERPALHVLMTTGSVTSAQLMADRLPPRAFHQFAPLDRAFAWRNFFTYWRPALGCLVESEIWPHLILEAERAHLPLMLINGRMSPRSASHWRWAGASVRRLLGSLVLCLARTQADAERFEKLGAIDVHTFGNLKDAAPPLPVDRAALAKLRAIIGDRPVWLAASTHAGEEKEVVSAHQRLCKAQPDLLTIIVPRHPERGDQLVRELSYQGDKIAQRSRGEQPDAETGLYLADTLGELGLFYRLARLAFIGGSLVPRGGQNPIEAARLGCPPLFGPHTGNFDEMTTELLERSAAKRVLDAKDLADTVQALFVDPARLAKMAASGIKAGADGSVVLERVQQAILLLLDQQRDPKAVQKPRHARA